MDYFENKEQLKKDFEYVINILKDKVIETSAKKGFLIITVPDETFKQDSEIIIKQLKIQFVLMDPNILIVSDKIKVEELEETLRRLK